MFSRKIDSREGSKIKGKNIKKNPPFLFFEPPYVVELQQREETTTVSWTVSSLATKILEDQSMK